MRRCCLEESCHGAEATQRIFSVLWDQGDRRLARKIETTRKGTKLYRGIDYNNIGLSNAAVPGARNTDLAAANNLLAHVPGANVQHMRWMNCAFFARDTWKERPRVSLNAGVSLRSTNSLFRRSVDEGGGSKPTGLVSETGF